MSTRELTEEERRLIAEERELQDDKEYNEMVARLGTMQKEKLKRRKKAVEEEKKEKVSDKSRIKAIFRATENDTNNGDGKWNYLKKFVNLVRHDRDLDQLVERALDYNIYWNATQTLKMLHPPQQQQQQQQQNTVRIYKEIHAVYEYGLMTRLIYERVKLADPSVFHILPFSFLSGKNNNNNNKKVRCPTVAEGRDNDNTGRVTRLVVVLYGNNIILALWGITKSPEYTHQMVTNIHNEMIHIGIQLGSASVPIPVAHASGMNDSDILMERLLFCHTLLSQKAPLHWTEIREMRQHFNIDDVAYRSRYASVFSIYLHYLLRNNVELKATKAISEYIYTRLEPMSRGIYNLNDHACFMKKSLSESDSAKTMSTFIQQQDIEKKTAEFVQKTATVPSDHPYKMWQQTFDFSRGEKPELPLARVVQSRSMPIDDDDGGKKSIFNNVHVILFDMGGTLFMWDNERARPDARDVLRELHKRGYRIGIITNTTKTKEHVHARLRSNGLSPFIEAETVSSDPEVGASKPQRRIYQVALERMGQSGGANVLFVGNDYINDIASPKRMFGVKTAHFHRGEQLPDADVRIESLPQLLSYLPGHSSVEATPSVRGKVSLEEAEWTASILNVNTEGVVPLETLRRGMEVELEHGSLYGLASLNVTGDSLLTTAKIALAHLGERLDYYELLEKLESSPITNESYRKWQGNHTILFKQ